MELKKWFYIILFLSAIFNLSAQTAVSRQGEKVSYDVYFKWGLMMPRAGTADFSYGSSSVKNSVSRYRLLFKTAKFFDNFFKMRDTLTCYYDNYDKLVYSKKNSDEGGYYLIDELTFTYSGDKSSIYSYRHTPTKVKVDTTLTATGDVSDILGAIHYVRKLDRKKLVAGAIYPLTVAIGRDLVKVQFVYQHQMIVEHGNYKYNTHYFKLNIYDDAFESTKTSAEVWVGDDDNFLPIKVRSKLKIGAAEVYYKDSSGLKYPLNCRIEKK